MPTPHQRRVRAFMQRAGQDTPTEVTVPDRNTRILRAKLILEEALETIEALGVEVWAKGSGGSEEVGLGSTDTSLQFVNSGQVDLEGVADGCADISVVTQGTLIAFGIDDEPLLEEVDEANLRKFGPGGYRRDDGKWMKPADWQPPDIKGAIEAGDLHS
jgi:predicted HAD superfamily Cof-like phosphohydrolase